MAGSPILKLSVYDDSRYVVSRCFDWEMAPDCYEMQSGDGLGFFGVSAVWRYWDVDFWVWDCAWYNRFSN